MEREIKFKSKNFVINGTLTIPQKRKNHPVVILIPGSGPMDRDSTIGPNKPFRELAKILESRGIASLRFDKRTFTYKKEMIKQKKVTLNEEIIDDVISAIGFLKRKKKFSHYFLFGHSLGAWVTPLIANRYSLNGIIMACTPGRYLFELILFQNKFQIKNRKLKFSDYKSQLEEIKKVIHKIKKKKFLPEDVVFNVPFSYWYSLMKEDPRIKIKKLKIPILIIRCENDAQLYKKDSEIWENATKNMSNVIIKKFKKINHILSEYSKKSTGNEYVEKMSISHELAFFISNWINKISGR